MGTKSNNNCYYSNKNHDSSPHFKISEIQLKNNKNIINVLLGK